MKKRTKSSKKRKKRGARKKTQALSKPNTVSQSDVGAILPRQETKPEPYQVIPKRESEKREKEKGSVLKYFGVASQFLRESKMELKKVKWPTRKELLAATAMVIFLVLFVALFLGLADQGLIILIRKIVG